MPFKSESQRRFLWAKHPKIAEAWSHGKSSKTGKKEFTPKNKNLPMHVGSHAVHGSVKGSVRGAIRGGLGASSGMVKAKSAFDKMKKKK
jgi:hypothetical protein